MYKPTKCILCGDIFIPVSGRQKCCGKEITKICEVCGKEYTGHCSTSDSSHTCESKACKLEYTRRTKKANLSNQTRVCRVCGKEFHPKSPTQTICDNPHYRTCVVCGKEFELKRINGNELSNAVTCCKECENINRAAKIKAALAEKPIGYNAPKTLHHKICKWCGKPFDTYNANQVYCDGIHTKHCIICGKEFIVDNRLLGNSIISQTCSSECHKKHVEQINFERYGVANYAQSQEYKESLALKKDDIQAKRESTMIEHYGVKHISQTKNWINHTMVDSRKLDNYLNFKQNPVDFIQNTFPNISPTISMLSKEIGVNESSTLSWIHKYNIENLVNIQYSSMEAEVENFLLSLDPTIKIVHNERSVIKPMEIDIYLPDYRIGIECNPTSTHNSTKNNWNPNLPGIPYSYHQRKTNLANENNVFLFHLFEYEWTHKNAIMKSIIKNLIHMSNRRIFARNTKIVDVDYDTTNTFLDENHRQGSCTSSIRYGLEYNGELVAIMTFGKPRHTIGKQSEDWELLRFCNKLDTSVIGGASKLFKQFTSLHPNQSIISFSDRARTQGNLYEILGFKHIRNSDPGYVWVDEKTDVAYNRIRAQKANIQKLLNDPNLDISKSENYNMTTHGFVRVFDSGSTVWVYN